MHLNFVQHTQNNRLITYITEPYILLNIFVSLHIRSKYDNTIPGFDTLVASITFQIYLTKVLHILSFGAAMGLFFEEYNFSWCCYWCWRYCLCLLMVCLSWTVSSPYVLNWVDDCWLCNCLSSFLHSCMMQTKEIVALCLNFVHYYGIFTLIFWFELISEKCLIT